MKREASGALLAVAAAFLILSGPAGSAQDSEVTEGSLIRLGSDGKPAAACPLKHTDVKADISGFLARVTVTQEFENPFSEKIEAVYTFPMPHNAAVDDMTMLVGGRVVRGKIKRREEAQKIYDAARAAGKVAALLDQERPNIFTQMVANIMPGESVKINISYVETLQYEEGSYQFVFPMVVGPRYIPRALDASRITPPVARPGTRAGHDISLAVTLDAGVPVGALVSSTHEVDVARPAASKAVVRLKDRAVIPNKDFILRYEVAGNKIQDALLAHSAARGGFFTLIVQPPERITAADVTPKELVFVLDTSGSMTGRPIEKAKQAMRLALEGLYSQDTFNLITFSGDTSVLFPEPVRATRENLARAQTFLESRRGSGGTEMMKAIRAALEPSDSQSHVRVVCFMTDGYVGNDLEIIAEIQKHPNARIFSFGIGNSVNRLLLDKMAQYGRGEVEYVGLTDDGEAAARRFHERVRNPLLTDIAVDWGGLAVTDVYPTRIPDLFGAKPVILTGRYQRSGRGIVRLRGKMSGRSVTREIAVDLPSTEPDHEVLATLWARARIDDLSGTASEDVREAITQLGLDYRLMTQFTSFVAVEEMTVTTDGQPRRVEVPVEMPDGVSYRGVFGEVADAAPSAMPIKSRELFSVMRFAPGKVAQVRTTASKLDPSLTAIAEQLRQGGPNPGKLKIEVTLVDVSPETLAQLKRIGFETISSGKAPRTLVGRIGADTLAALAEMKAVQYVALTK